MKWLMGIVWLLAPASALAHTIEPCYCDQGCYTNEVTKLTCTPDKARFKSTGLPASTDSQMIGIRASNQQFPAAHDFEFEINRSPRYQQNTTATEPGAIGVAVNGVPLFNPDTQGPAGATGKRPTAFDAGELDDCGGHAGRGDDYHYHIAPKCLIENLGADHVEKLKKPIGFAMDGFPILALGWFEKSNDVEALLDLCRGMFDENDSYFYNVMNKPKWDILNCFHGRPRGFARDRWRPRLDKNQREIVGLPIRFEIQSTQRQTEGNDVCHTMTGRLSNEQILTTSGQTRRISSQSGSIFHCNAQCYGLFFEAERKPQFRGRVLYYDLITERCPIGFDPSQIKTFEAYLGPPQPYKGPPPTGRGPAPGGNRPPADGRGPPPKGSGPPPRG